MADQNFIPGDMRVGGNVLIGGRLYPDIKREWLAQDVLKAFPINPMLWRVWDAVQSNLPNPSAADDLGIYGGTYGTDPVRIRTYDVKAAGAQTLRARAVIPVPAEYDAGQTLLLRAWAGMITTIADTSCTLDVEAWKIDKDGTLGAADLYTGAALDINSLTFDDKDFELTASGLSPGDLLDVRISIAVNDAASITAVIAAIDSFELVCDVRG